MPWVRFTDDWYDDEDMAGATPLALAMWAVGITWSARNLTDGRIPRSQVRKLLDVEDITMNGAKCRADDIASELVQLGKWTASDRGFTISNYHRYQPTREQVVAQRKANAERQRRFKQGNATGNAVSNSASRLPSPDDTFLSSNGSLQPRPQAVDDDEMSTVPVETWDHYAQLKLDRQTAGAIKNPGPWKRTTARNAQTELGEQAQRWYGDFDVTARDLAAWLIDGKPSPYAKHRERTPR